MNGVSRSVRGGSLVAAWPLMQRDRYTRGLPSSRNNCTSRYNCILFFSNIARCVACPISTNRFRGLAVRRLNSARALSLYVT